ncbi:MAG: hypothetical protein CMI18_10000 [Opitutaceae bacterium]|nr:hypothetical protein [Opitutaceae bacterium]
MNNWDPVNCSAHPIAGGYLFERSRRPLYKFSKSKLLWDKRISINSTYYFIKRNYLADTLKLSRILLAEKHDLMYQAVSSMLRELGKQNQQLETEFLDEHYHDRPRSMLRYAIENILKKTEKVTSRKC